MKIVSRMTSAAALLLAMSGASAVQGVSLRCVKHGPVCTHALSPLSRHSIRSTSPRCCESPLPQPPQPPPPPPPPPPQADEQLPQVDMRGFVVPQVGDVVKMPSKWPGEWEVAQVDYVQTVQRAGGSPAVEVDLLPLKAIGDGCYRLPGGRGKPTSVRADIGKLGKLKSEYVRENDSYRIDEAQLTPVMGRKEADPLVLEQSLAEYEALKAGLLRDAALVGAAAAAAALPTLGADVSVAVALGSVAGCGYLWLLGAETEARMGIVQAKPVAIAASGRLLLPVVLMCALAARQAAGGGQLAPLSVLPPESFAGGAFGFLSYKLPLLGRQVARAIEELTTDDAADVPLTQMGALPTGSIGMAMRVASQRTRELAERRENEEGAAAKVRAQVVLAGPSGVGKSTLIGRLLADPELAGRFSFSVSSTTRPIREGERDGVDYNFVSREAFEATAAAGGFLESATVGGNRYGTSVAAVAAVGKEGKCCLLDLDLQGVQAVLTRAELVPFCVWVAPPTFETLRERLLGRGTEDAEEVERRVARARAEIEAALEAKCFDRIIINDKLDVAYDELKQVLLGVTAPQV